MRDYTLNRLNTTPFTAWIRAVTLRDSERFSWTFFLESGMYISVGASVTTPM